MESKAILFNEQEKLFKEKTGTDFLTLYKKYYPKLVFFTTKICNDVQKAEDISTDSFLTAFEKINKYDLEKSQFSTWLFTIAKNIALQEIKNAKKITSIDINLDDDGTTMKDFIENKGQEINMNDIYDMKADIMKKHISKLKNPYREVIEMREIKKMSYKDIAKELKRNLSTVKSQIRNGRVILIKGTFKEFKQIDDLY
jgi:RNA polymerase sigma-70 factor (ECF subfamily)